MLPFLAQGAGMAIEDAAVLADMLGADIPTIPPTRCARYERARRAPHRARAAAPPAGKAASMG